MEITTYVLDGNISQPENSYDGYKDYNGSDYSLTSHNTSGRDAIRATIDGKGYDFIFTFYTRGGTPNEYLVPNNLRFFGTNEDTLDTGIATLIGTVGAKVIKGTLNVGIAEFSFTTSEPYKYILFDFFETTNNSSVSGHWYWNEIEIKTEKIFINKILISSTSGDIVSSENDGTNDILKYIPSQDEQSFLNHGIDGGTPINPQLKYSHAKYINNTSTTLGNGKVFEQPIDKYIKSLNVK